MSADFTWLPDYGMEESEELRLRSVKYGEGYEQRYADGINNIKREIPVTFSVDPTTAGDIVDFLRARNNGQPFTFQVPGGDIENVMCRSWSRRWDSYGIHTVSATFERVYD